MNKVENRTEVIIQIGDKIENNCHQCEHGRSGVGVLKKICVDECEVGKELRELGKLLEPNPVTGGVKSRWKKEEEQFILDNYLNNRMLSQAQVAEALNRKLPTVRDKIYKMRKKIKKGLL